MKFGRDGAVSAILKPVTPQDIIQSELDNDEELIWAGKPISVLNHGKSSLPNLLIGMPFFGFSIFWIYNVMGFFDNDITILENFFGSFFAMFGIPFVLMGLGFIVSPFWKMYIAKKLTYALTTKRLIIRERLPFVKVKSWPLGSVTNLIRYSASSQIGDLYFAEEIKTSSKGHKRVEKIGFIGIANPRGLEKMIRKEMKRH